MVHVVPKNTFEDFFLDYFNNESNEHNDTDDRQPPAEQSRTKSMHLLSATNELFHSKTLSNNQTLSSTDNLTLNEKKFSNDHYGMDCFGISSSNSNSSSNDNSSNSASNASSNCNSDSDSDFVMISESECAEL